MKLPSWLCSLWSGIGVGIIAAAVVFIVGGLSWCHWWDCTCREWLVTGPVGRESGSTTIRNLGLVIGGIIAIVLAYWRSIVADRQARATQQQAETAERGLLNERYQRGAAMLGSPVLSVRLGGIYALQHLAENEPNQYHVQILRLLCAFVRDPTNDKDRDDNNEPEDKSLTYDRVVRKDVQAAMTAVGTRNDIDVALENKKKKEFELDLTGAHLSFANLAGANLADANLSGAVFYYARLRSANLTGANLTDAVLFNADLVDTNLTGVNLTAARGLTQDQLSQAQADPAHRPKLDHAEDSSSGDRLEWRDGKA